MENTNIGEVIMMNAKEVGSKKYACVPISLLSVDPAYQRTETVNTEKVAKIANDWDNRRCDALKVSYRDGRFWIIDGQHRYHAALIAGVPSLECEIFTDMSIYDEADMYVTLNMCKTPLNTFNQFKANLIRAAQRITPDVVASDIVNRVCKDFHVAIACRRGRAPSGYLGSLTEALRTAMHGEDALRWSFEILADAGWITMFGGLSSPILYALRKMYTLNRVDSDKIKSWLTVVLSRLTPNQLKEEAVRCCYVQGDDRSIVYKYLSDKYAYDSTLYAAAHAEASVTER